MNHTGATALDHDHAQALSDVKVLELGSMLAGPLVGTLLADFGAEVIKVEKPGTLDPLRAWPPDKDGALRLCPAVLALLRVATHAAQRPKSCLASCSGRWYMFGDLGTEDT